MLLSKTIQLGVIVLALRLLGKLHVPAPRIISLVARLLGVSRKAGYEAAERIEKALSEEKATKGEEKDLRHENRILRIRNQVLTYQCEHPGVRFGERGRHLPAEARSFCVRLLRDFKEDLSESEIAALLGVPLSSLRRWDREADEDAAFPAKPDRRGLHRHATAEDARAVAQEFKKLRERGESLTLEEFTEHYRRQHPERPLDRRTITRILQAEGLREVETRNSTEPYHEKFEIFFPGAQVAIDATKCHVTFKGDSPERITVVKEVAIDIATQTILGDALETHENSRGVRRVLVEARKECVSLLAVLSDNGSANRSETTRHFIERESGALGIFSFPYHPQTNGHLEGVFGQFSRIAGEFEIDDSSREALARSIVEVIFRVYGHFHNYSPRKRLDGMSPLEYLRRFGKPPPEKIEEARRGLERRKERSEARRYPPERLSDPRFRSLVRGALEHCRIHKALDEALSALLHYESQAIESAATAFFTYSQRDSFDESKRTFPYFMGIVRRKQKEIDEGRARAEVGRQKVRRLQAECEAQQQKLEREKAQEAEDLRREPERVVLSYADLLLRGGLRLMRRTWTEGLRRGLRALLDLGRPRRVVDQLAETIRAWGDFGEELKRDMVELLYVEYEASRG